MVNKLIITENLEKLLLDSQKDHIRWFVEELYCHTKSQRNKIIEAIPDINEAGI